MRRRSTSVLALLLALGLGAATAAPARAVELGKPKGRLFEAIVAHEVGHCLGWLGHAAPYPSIMRGGLDTARIQNGTHQYLPTAADVAGVAKSRADSLGRTTTATTNVTAPFISDMVVVYNLTGVASVIPTVKRWDSPTSPIFVSSYWREPGQGITIQWDESINGTGALAVALPVVVSSGGRSWVADCTVKIGTKVASLA